MDKEEAIDILKNCIADYVIGDFCVGKFCPMEKECKDKECVFEQAIDIVSNYIEELEHKYNRALDTIIKYEKTLENLQNDTIWKREIRELKEKIHNDLDNNGITRAYQIKIDEYFEELIGEDEK